MFEILFLHHILILIISIVPPEYASMRPGPSFAKAIGMQCVFSFGNRSVPNAKIVALSEINLAFGLKNGPAKWRGTTARGCGDGFDGLRRYRVQMRRRSAYGVRRSKYVLVGFQQDYHYGNL